ncbi:hypothetical protein ACIQ4I_13325 [Rummeliibacillus sp. NPDC094406]|uniref:hypothetical protein n=1 Tax=Rummeliibacillus sp. NPDC094406 TaxID=3364511 RepID=UPI0037F36731
MRKRIKKKIENRYNALNNAIRQSHKRKGNKFIRYEFLPIGKRDKYNLNNDELTYDYPYATHWLIEAIAWKHDNISQIRIFPCSKNGGTTDISPVQIIVFYDINVNEILETFEKVVEDMKSDRFWNTIY